MSFYSTLGVLGHRQYNTLQAMGIIIGYIVIIIIYSILLDVWDKTRLYSYLKSTIGNFHIQRYFKSFSIHINFGCE